MGELMVECIQTFEEARRKHLRIKLDFNWYVKTFLMHEFPKAPITTFGITDGVLNKDKRKRQNRTKFL